MTSGWFEQWSITATANRSPPPLEAFMLSPAMLTMSNLNKVFPEYTNYPKQTYSQRCENNGL